MQRLEGLGQRDLAGAVEVRVRFVEHEQARVSVERTCQRDALTLTGRQHHAHLVDHGVVAFGERKHHLVHAGALGGTHHLRGVDLA